ncbi:MAG: isocitrate lyase/phosphoenolpyruvate mutase family protein [Pseudomonadota bacterium]
MSSAFRALHQPGNPFILANAWDVGSARMLAALGAEAIGTTSAGHAFTLGAADMGVTREAAISHLGDLAAATPLPVSGDLENGFGDDPAFVAETIRLAAAAGGAGCSIEDVFPPAPHAYDRAAAVARVKAAVEAARALPDDFVVVARADGVMNGLYDLDEALWRIKAYEDVGADCVYVPAPGDADALEQVVKAVNVPVNALAVGKIGKLGRKGLADMGVGRISVGAALARMTHKVLHDEALTMFVDGMFGAHKMLLGPATDDLLKRGAR